MRRLARAVPLVLAVVAFAPSRTARACGGFFRTQTESASVTLDQSAVRLVFEIGDEVVTAHVAVQYQGDASAFAWVIPVPAEPHDIDTSSVDLFEQLDRATAPQFVWYEEGGGGRGGGCSFGCGGAADKAGGGDFANEQADGVTIWSRQNVGPYETQVVSSDDPAALTNWLTDRGYAVPAVAEPVIAAYVSSGSYFLAMRLNAEASANDVVPITFQYAGTEPCVPLRMDAISATADQPVLVWVFGFWPVEPANWAQTEPQWSELRNLDGATNYVDLVTSAVDATGGQSWVTEYVDRSSNLGNAEEDWNGTQLTDPTLLAIRNRNVYVTRLFTTVSPDEMTVDPTFRLDPEGVTVEHTHVWGALDAAPRRPGLPGPFEPGVTLAIAVAGVGLGARRRTRRCGR